MSTLPSRNVMDHCDSSLHGAALVCRSVASKDPRLSPVEQVAPWMVASRGASPESDDMPHEETAQKACHAGRVSTSSCAFKKMDKSGTSPARPAHAKPMAKKPQHASKPRRIPANFAAFAASLEEKLEKHEYKLLLTPDGAGGAYFVVPHDSDDPVAIFKPSGEEIGMEDNPRGNTTLLDRHASAFIPGDGHHREVLAFELDHEHAAGVPETHQVVLHEQVGSLQRYVPKTIQSWSTFPAKFDVSAVQRICVFDIRLLNCDRHGGNLLVRRDDPGMCMIPIDHAFVLPNGWSEPEFEWMHWPQSAAPVKDEIRAYVARLDAAHDAALVEPILGVDAAEIIHATTLLLQVALENGKSHTLRQIAAYCKRQSFCLPSGLEKAVSSSRRDLDEGGDIDFVALREAFEAAFPQLALACV